MSRIQDAFKNGKAFIPFVTGGDPDLDTTEKLIYEMAQNGADLIEIGIPFSDPIAEGPVIQEADERSLRAGCTTDKLFDLVAKVRKTVDIPMVFMTYVNPIYSYGTERFMANCKKVGIDGVIVPDVPFEEKGELKDTCAKYSIELISLIAPTSKERIKMIAKEAEGFIYCVSSLGVTGVRSEITSDIDGMVALVREVTDIPVAIGFGIATPEQAEAMGRKADGVIVGSAIVRMVAADGRNSVEKVGKYVAEMKAAANK
jgi:tryptophan synthase alpha chain